VRNVFVIGLDDVNRAHLEALPGAGSRYRVHPLLDHETVRGVDEFPVEEWLRRCRAELDAVHGTVDAIVSFWDFPVTETAAILCAERGLPSPSLEAVLRCQHKYWSRLDQLECIPDAVPRFEAIDPVDDPAGARLGLPFPVWVKPVRSFRSYLGFRVGSPGDLATALESIRAGIDRIGDPLAWLLERVQTPPEVAALGGRACIAEQLVSGRQCTLEGYAFRGSVHVYGVVDSIRAANRSTFARYQYPSRLPRAVQARMADAAARLIAEAGFDGGPFNVEFFYDRARDHLWLLEVNCRVSQAHSGLFAKVDGGSHLEVMVDLALGDEPRLTTCGGEHAVAAKFFLRAWRDATVASVPDADELGEIERQVPGTSVQLTVGAGDRLSELPDQDSYSYELGSVEVGAGSEAEMRHRFRECERLLGIELTDQADPA
jgi:hypothetical protein